MSSPLSFMPHGKGKGSLVVVVETTAVTGQDVVEEAGANRSDDVNRRRRPMVEEEEEAEASDSWRAPRRLRFSLCDARSIGWRRPRP